MREISFVGIGKARPEDLDVNECFVLLKTDRGNWFSPFFTSHQEWEITPIGGRYCYVSEAEPLCAATLQKLIEEFLTVDDGNTAYLFDDIQELSSYLYVQVCLSLF